MKKTGIRLAAVSLAAALTLSFAACSSGSEETGSAGGAASMKRTDSAAAQEASNLDAEAPAAQESPLAGATASEEVAEVAADEDTAFAEGSGAGLPGTSRKITFSASYTLETKRYDEDYARIVNLVRDAGGYIAGEETVAYPYETEGMTGRSSYFSLKIPVDGYDSFLDKLAKVGEVGNKSKSSEDLTAEYFDTESRIEILKMRRDRLTGYIQNATKAADIVEFEKELSEVLSELDQYEGNKRRLDQLVDYATVDVSLNEMISPETIGKDGQPLGGRASDAFRISATGVGEFLQNTAVFFAGAAPVIALIVVILVVIWLIVRGVRRARAKYREGRPEKRGEKRRPEAEQPGASENKEK